MPTPYSLQASGTLGSLNPGAAAALAAIAPLLAQIDGLLGAQFGLGSLKADLAAQYEASVSLALTISDPFTAMKAVLEASIALVGQIQAALAAGIAMPAFSVSAVTQLQLIAALQVKLGAINALIEAALGIKLAGLNFAGQLQAALSAGPAALYAGTGQTLAASLSQIASHDYSDVGLVPGDTVHVVVLVSKAPSFYAGASFLFPMPPE